MKRNKRQSSGIVGYAVSILLGAVVMFGLLFAVVFAIQEDNANYAYTETTVYYVDKGDTLWTIAKQYSDNRHDVRKVVDEIEQLSGCTAYIYPGDRLTIPLYEVMKNAD